MRGDVGHQFVAVTADDKLERLAEHLRRERGLAPPGSSPRTLHREREGVVVN